jgi:hypothetical protein
MLMTSPSSTQITIGLKKLLMMPLAAGLCHALGLSPEAFAALPTVMQVSVD